MHDEQRLPILLDHGTLPTHIFYAEKHCENVRMRECAYAITTVRRLKEDGKKWHYKFKLGSTVVWHH